MKKQNFIFVSIFWLLSCNFTFAATPFKEPPAWAKHAVWYQIFVERFYNGDIFNDPRPEFMTVADMNIVPPAGWKISSWIGDWFERDSWMKNSDKSFSELLQYRRYGGDLKGVLEKLDYLQKLGINAIYLNPINDAPSLHKYDARNYHHVDVNFGPDPEGDLRIISGENPADPTSWQWTSADKLFLQLIEEVHRRGMKIIVDYSWNHTGTLFWAWRDILKNQAASPFKNWYNITRFDDPKTPENEFAYEGWYGNAYMPEIRKTNLKSKRVNGQPYEGNLDENAKRHIFEVSKRWLSPNGDITKGVDGFRLDVAEQIGLDFWREYRAWVRSINPDAYLVGEIWWEKWPDKMMNPAPYTKGDMFDAVMFYQVYCPARYFFAKTIGEINAEQFRDSLLFQWNRLKQENLYAMMNVSSTHDTPRLLTDFYNPNRYKFHATINDDPFYKTGKPDKLTYRRLKLYLVHLFTTIGAPQIWNGEEMGMWGADDPYCRKPLWWKEFNFHPENRNNILPVKAVYDPVQFDNDQFEFYKKLIAIRNTNHVLADGEFEFVLTKNKTLAYKRFDKNSEILVFFNLEDYKQNFSLNGKYIDLLTGKKVMNNLTLNSLSASVLKKLD